MENFFIYDTHNEKILFSPQKDDELYSSLLQNIQSIGGKTFELGENEYYFLNSPLTKNISAIFFTESRMTDETILMDMLMYFGGAILLSLIIYLISIRFVDNTLAPVERSINDMEQFIHNA